MKRKCNIKLTKIEDKNDINLNQYAEYLQELLDCFPKKYKDKAINEVTSSGNASYKSMIKLAIDSMNEDLKEKIIDEKENDYIKRIDSIRYFIKNFDNFSYAKSETNKINNFFNNSDYEDIIKIIFKRKNSVALDLLITYTIAFYTVIIDEIINIIKNTAELDDTIRFNKPRIQNILNNIDVYKEIVTEVLDKY